MGCYNLMGIIVENRYEDAVKVQDLLTKYGCMIKIRLGLHEAGEVCSDEGFIVLQLCGSNDEIQGFCEELNAINGVSADFMTIKGR